MRKRQFKKNLRRHVRLYMDESPLLFMSQEEMVAAYEDRDQFLKKIAKLPYKRIKNLKVMYFFPLINKHRDWFNSINTLRTRKASVTVSQSLQDFA
ncbi:MULTISPECIES: hypothetical protein [Paenibacillus]|uniref:hypothetical protein n=1 Tax=Paenibacillus TaxID=44249 RepID=UPI00040716A2|nr:MULTISPECIES: hypothetical protein [Paenibacillus]KGP81119.1 hypothetical protein P364_0117655 [Paenibacillus sp. MAEPY2]KGP86171.1 hypothetical protein P363_0119055 [Paenibacillus sp. MAEPY1]OZQ71027.1 hypothetical protein CA599_10845 [Paenibacillus taichungensis]